MSVYYKRFNVCVGNVSSYHDTLEEVADHLASVPLGEIRFVLEGYADERDHGPDRPPEVIRRTTRAVPLSEVHAVLQERRMGVHPSSRA